jgi:hypothetical protein
MILWQITISHYLLMILLHSYMFQLFTCMIQVY